MPSTAPARLLRAVFALLFVVVLPWAILAAEARADVGPSPSHYSYDSPPAATTAVGDPRAVTLIGRPAPRTSPGVVHRVSGRFLAAKARGGADEAFHYTRSEVVDLIEKNGLRPGSYLTKSGDLSPLQAQIDLALPPNRGLPGATIRVDLAGMRKAGYDIGDFTRVGRKYNMPGGGTELQFEKAIPPRFLSVLRR